MQTMVRDDFLTGFLDQTVTPDGTWAAEEQFPMVPTTTPGIPDAGPDFVRRAQFLAGDRPDMVPVYLRALQGWALYENWFTMDVMVKGSPMMVRFIPGHLWGLDRATGPRSRADVMIIGKMPGKDEIREGCNLTGASGTYLRAALEAADTFAPEYNSWYVTNLMKFGHPAPQQTSAIAKDWIKDCLPLLHQELRIVRPKFILCLGSEAGKTLLGPSGAVLASTGKVFDYDIPLPDGTIHKAKLMTCLHPAAVAREPDNKPQLDSTVRLFSRLVKGESIGALETDIEHIVARTEAEAIVFLAKMIKETENGGAVAVDCEWQGEYPFEPGAWLRTVQVSHKSKFALCLVMRLCGGAPNLCESTKVKELLTKLFKRPNIRPVGHFHRADLPWLLHYGVDIRKEFEAPAAPATGWECTKYEGGFDTGMAAHAYCETDDFKLEVQATRLVGCPRYDMMLQEAKKKLCAELKISADDLPGYGDIPDEVLYPYACYDVDVTRRLFDIYNGVGDQPGLLDCDDYGNNCRTPFWISMRASPACLEMEQTGLYVDMSRANTLIDRYRSAQAAKILDLREITRWPDFNLNSSYDCRELLYGTELRRQVDKATQQNKRGSPPTAKLCQLMPIKATGKTVRKTWAELEASGEAAQYTPATDKETLGILFHQTKNDEEGVIVGTLRDARFLAQLLKMTAKLEKPKPVKKPRKKKGVELPLPPPLDEPVPEDEPLIESGLLSYVCSDFRIYTHIFQTLETGRYASARPNLQNISKRREADYKRILGPLYPYPLRSIFVAPPGKVLIEADYVGAELAGMAWMSGDPVMTEHVRRAQLPEDHPDYYDIHSAVAVAAFQLDCPATKKGLASINKVHLRVAAKNVVFGYAYGRGAAAICRQAKEEGVIISEAEAQALINGLQKQYAYLPIFFGNCRKRVHDPMWMCNPYGRYRRFRPTMESDFKTRGECERQGMNFTIQSLVADAVSRALDHFYTRREGYGLHYKIALQIHDAVLLEVPVEEAEVVFDKVIPECMTDLVPVYPCDLDGMPITGTQVQHLATDREMYIRWGEKLYKDECEARGIPLRFGKERKK